MVSMFSEGNLRIPDRELNGSTSSLVAFLPDGPLSSKVSSKANLVAKLLLTDWPKIIYDVKVYQKLTELNQTYLVCWSSDWI